LIRKLFQLLSGGGQFQTFKAKNLSIHACFVLILSLRKGDRGAVVTPCSIEISDLFLITLPLWDEFTDVKDDKAGKKLKQSFRIDCKRLLYNWRNKIYIVVIQN